MPKIILLLFCIIVKIISCNTNLLYIIFIGSHCKIFPFLKSNYSTLLQIPSKNQLGNMLNTKIVSTNFLTNFQTQATENLIIIHHLFSNILFTKLQIVIKTAIVLKLQAKSVIISVTVKSSSLKIFSFL